jgi:hypothetical protein
MSMTNVEHADFTVQEREATISIVAGGSFAEAIGGIGAVVLAILGLVGVMPEDMAAIATLAVGVALLFQGIAVATRFSNLFSQTGKSLADAAELGGGMGAEFLGGAAGGILGVLAILNIAPMTLMSIAIIVFGASLLLSSTTTYRVDSLSSKLGQTTLSAGQTLAALAASGIQVLVGIAGIALGIIALVGVSTMILILVGLLCVGGSILISGTALSGTVATVLQH